MELIRLRDSRGKIFDTAMKLYEKSFPKYERRSYDAQQRAMYDEQYHFDLIYDEGEFIGEVLYWDTDSFIYIEHFCILTEKRNRKYGERTLSMLQGCNKTIILEIDPPKDEISVRRRGFYERNGFKLNDFEHFAPAYTRGGSDFELKIMTYPGKISKELYDNFYEFLCAKVKMYI